VRQRRRLGDPLHHRVELLAGPHQTIARGEVGDLRMDEARAAFAGVAPKKFQP